MTRIIINKTVTDIGTTLSLNCVRGVEITTVIVNFWQEEKNCLTVTNSIFSNKFDKFK